MMKRILLLLAICAGTLTAAAQGSIKGKVLDKATDEPMPFVNIVVTKRNDTKMVKGGITDENGAFNLTGIPDGEYTLNISYVGYKELKRNLAITPEKRAHTYAALYIAEDAKLITEVTVTGQRSTVKLEVDRKSFDVTQDIANAGGSASEVLENIPSVEVDNDGNVSLRGNSSVEVWINGKASGLTADNRAQILQQLPAESIERIEVIDNPSAKFSAEGSAGIINIILKKERKAGYYGSLQAGANTRGGANLSGNINYNSSLFDAYLNLGFRHRNGKGGSMSRQEYLKTGIYQNYDGTSKNQGNNLFTRAGITWHATKKDDFTLSGMMMHGKFDNNNIMPYHYGTIGAPNDTYVMYRHNSGEGDMHMYYGEFNYRHSFTDRHYLDFVVNFNRWVSDNENYYRDSTYYFDDITPTTYSYQYRPMFIRNRAWEMKLDYENPITDKLKLQTGYQGRFSHENTPQESWLDQTSWEGRNAVEDRAYFNRFIYDLDVHALYLTLTYNFGKFGLMGGLRGEYWRVNTESYSWEQEHDPSLREPAFKKNYFQLFPSIFMSYQLTETQQLQLNYTRRLRRPWGGELNSFKNTQDASMVQFGNPELTPEYSHSFSLNYLKQWPAHSLLLSAYYRPTTDVIQRIRWQSSTDGVMYQTNRNVAKSQSTGLEMVLKNKFFRILDLTTTANAYYYKLNGFSYDIDGQTVTGEGNDNFTWNIRSMASIILPYDMTFQVTGSYRAKQVITQGYRKPNWGLEIGARKNFFNKALTIALNCRDVFNTRKWEIVTEGDGFKRHQKFWRNGRNVNLTVTWNFGNMKGKRQRQDNNMQNDDPAAGSGYGSGIED